MNLANSIKPISFVKAHTAEIIRDLAESRQPVIITQNGEAKAVLQDIRDYENTQETLALLKILALGRKDLEQGKVKPATESFASVRAAIKRRRS